MKKRATNLEGGTGARRVSPDFNKDSLESLYARYNRREFVHPDPLEFLYQYDNPGDREIAGLVAASLAYGRVAQILKSVGRALKAMGCAPHEFLMQASDSTLKKRYDGFKHRFTTGEDLAFTLAGARDAIDLHGSLKNCFISHYKNKHETLLDALDGFSEEITSRHGGRCYLIPAPCGGSACKRMNLFLRWMVRKDEVDPGDWSLSLPASKLVIPLDAHMWRIATEYGLTQRKQVNLASAIEITGEFRKIAPEDPIKYDFSLTRPGIMWSYNHEKNAIREDG
jgi:uncharacterized protein (TIGR02757 family)